jgi:hypothetical protein
MSASIRPSIRLMIAAANALVGLGEPQADARLRAIARGAGLGELLDAALASEEDSSWDVALVQHIGYWSHFDFASGESAWPLPSVRTPDELWDIASRHHVTRDEPRAGDIFLQYGPGKKQFVRAGLVAQVMESADYTPAARGARRYYDIVAIEGATELDGRLGGKHVVRLVRRLVPECGDRFVRWLELDVAHVAALALGPARIVNGNVERRAAA